MNYLGANAARLKEAGLDYCLSRDGLVELFCRDCDFFREDERELECNALKVLRLLLAKGLLAPKEVIDAVTGE